MNKLMDWIFSQSQAAQFLPHHLKRIVEPEEGLVPTFWTGPTASKIIAHKFPSNFGHKSALNPNFTTILGGMCLLNTVEMRRIFNREIVFDKEDDFERWFASWYPRIDQVHDAVGVPPCICKKIVYVSEDSFFAGRLASYTGLDQLRLQDILRRVHENQGHKVLGRYLKALGYSGELTVVYTSDLDRELSLALSMWERMLGLTFNTCDRDFAKVELMYTGFWLDILGLKKSAIIYESAGKMLLKGRLKLSHWFQSEPFGSNLNRNLGISGYVPFLTSLGDSSVLPFDEVPNRQNYRTFVIPEEDVLWYVSNLLFSKKTVVKEGPLSLPKEKALCLIAADLPQYFEEEISN
jgi:hypothetical protein